ncbi:hypothetical protein NKG05_00305 [Oerskovia sp. M15]
MIADEAAGSAFTLRHRDGREIRTATGLPGGFNVANAALALAMVLEAARTCRTSARPWTRSTV